MQQKCHIVIACSYLHVPGGYEKAVTGLANLFVSRGYKITLLILDQTADTFYPADPLVQIVHLPVNFGITSAGNALSRKFWLWRDTRKLIQKLKSLHPDHLICSEYHFAISAIMGGAAAFTRVYSWEHHHFGVQEMNRFWTLLFKRFYPKLDAVVCLNRDEQAHYRQLNRNTVVIPNFIHTAGVRSYNNTTRKNFSLISVTRFNSIKGIDLLMKIAKILLPQYPEIRWKVIGYGEQQDEFIDFIRKEKLTGQLIFQPADKSNLAADYQDADLFVMTSRNECFPLVLLEAMSLGLPCVAFDCETGPRHIIRNNETGILVNPGNVTEMASSIIALIRDPDRRLKMSNKASAIVHQYDPDNIFPLWKKLFEERFDQAPGGYG